MKPIIEVNHLSKKYSIGQKQEYYTLRDTLSNPLKSLRNKKEEFWALKDVSFSVNQGEVLGVIGPNGAGKSTLLKILSRITPPTEGEVVMRGRVASLLEVGTGFHQELTGRENIYLNGSILGMSKKEIDQKFDEIVKFAEISKFLDTPIKHYSSGMKVKLAFSVAVHLEPEILLIDEVLSVGDTKFRKKSLKKMEQITKDKGRTIIFVSHDLDAVSNLCKKSLLLFNNRLVKQGKTEEVLDEYLGEANETTTEIKYKSNGNKTAKIIKTKLLQRKKHFKINETIKFNTLCQVLRKDSEIYLAISLRNEFGQEISFWRDFEINKKMLLPRNKGEYKYHFEIPANILIPGTYYIGLSLGKTSNKDSIHTPTKRLSFEIINDNKLRQQTNFPTKGLVLVPINMKTRFIPDNH